MNSSRSSRRVLLRILGLIIFGWVLFVVAGAAFSRLGQNVPAIRAHLPLFRESVQAIVVFTIGLWIAALLVGEVERRLARGRRDLYGLTLLIRIAVYIVLLAIILSIFHVSLAGILAGSAVGGVVLGFAIHTFASNLLTGIFATASGTLNYGDVVAVNSWIWSLNTIGKVVEIKALFSKIETPDGSIVSLPNSALLGSSVLVSYRREGDCYVYPVQTCINADVPLEAVIREARRAGVFRRAEIYVQSRDTVNNTVRLLLRFREASELNRLVHEAICAVDAAYWKVRNGSTLYGPSSLAADDETYPYLVTLPTDVPSARLLEHVRTRGLRVALVGRSANSHSFLVTLPRGEDLDRRIEEATLAIEEVYRDLKESGSRA